MIPINGNIEFLRLPDGAIMDRWCVVVRVEGIIRA